MPWVIKLGFLGSRLTHAPQSEVDAGLAAGNLKYVFSNWYKELKVPLPVLASLSISNSAGQVGQAFDANVIGAKDGSALAVDPATPLPSGVTFDGLTRQFSGMPSAPGSFPVTLIETLDGAVGSPKSTAVGPIVIAAAVMAAAAPSTSKKAR